MKKVYDTWRSFYEDMKDFVVGYWSDRGLRPKARGEYDYKILDLDYLDKHRVVWRLGRKDGGERLRFEPTRDEIWIKEPYLNTKERIEIGASKYIVMDKPGPDRKFCVVYGPDYKAVDLFTVSSYEEVEKKFEKIKKMMSKKLNEHARFIF